MRAKIRKKRVAIGARQNATRRIASKFLASLGTTSLYAILNEAKRGEEIHFKKAKDSIRN